MNKRRPKFLRQETHTKKRFKQNPTWRKPAGKRSKMRTKEAAKQDMPDIGWRGPAAVRGFHPSGLREVVVHNVSELEGLTKENIVKVASAVGQKKKFEIVKGASERGLKIANPALVIILKDEEGLEAVLPVRAYAKCVVSPKATEEERKKLLEAAEKHGVTLEGSE